MKILKEREMPHLLRVYEALRVRKELSLQEYYAFLNVKKGFEGEIRYDKKLLRLNSDVLAINDLALTQSGKYRQIDGLIWTATGIATFELKNYEGDFVYKDGKLFTSSRKEIENPLHQVERTNIFLRNVLSDLGYYGTVDSYLVFMNENFHLYQSPLNKQILYPHQLDKLFDQINSVSSPLSNKDLELAEKLVSMHCPDSPFVDFPAYTYDELRKGVCCPHCTSSHLQIEARQFVCLDCLQKEKVTGAILRTIVDFMILFPDLPVTTEAIYEWSGRLIPKQRIYRFLAKHFQAEGYGRWRVYK